MIKVKLSDDGTTLDFTDEPVELDYNERAIAGIFLARFVLESDLLGDTKHSRQQLIILRGLAQRILYRDPPPVRELREINKSLRCLRDTLRDSPIGDIAQVLDRIDATIKRATDDSV
jgi:hypothetical protein